MDDPSADEIAFVNGSMADFLRRQGQDPMDWVLMRADEAAANLEIVQKTRHAERVRHDPEFVEFYDRLDDIEGGRPVEQSDPLAAIRDLVSSLSYAAPEMQAYWIRQLQEAVS